MPRTARYNIPGSTYHVISRFVDGRWLITDDEERETYLRMLGAALAYSDWRCLAYAVMSSHIHIAAIAGRRPMSSWTKRVNSPFAWWLNNRHGRRGPVFADRAKDYGALAPHEGQLLAYIHNNPVRAGVVPCAAKSSWTSHRAYTGAVRAPAWLHVDEGLRRAGFDDRDVFDHWVEVTPGQSHNRNLEKQRREVRRRGAIQFATPTFDGDEIMIPLVARAVAHVRPDPRHLIDVVAAITEIPRSLLCSGRRNPHVVQARSIAAHAARVLGLTPTETAAALGISSQAITAHSSRPIGGYLRELVHEVVARCELRLRAQAA